MIRYKIKTIVQVAITALFFGSCAPQNSKMKDNMPSFHSALDTHLKAIKEKNIETFEPTVAENVSTMTLTE